MTKSTQSSLNDPRQANRRNPWGSVLLILSLGLGACQTTVTPERVFFTQAMQDRYGLTGAELRALQYYISERVVLERVVSEGVREVARGRLVLRGDRAIQQIVIARGTPGVVEAGASPPDPDGDTALPISFAMGAPLPFAPRTPGGRYALQPASRQGLLASLLATLQIGTPPVTHVHFQGAVWRVPTGQDALLLVERDAFGDLVRERRTLPGLSLPETR